MRPPRFSLLAVVAHPDDEVFFGGLMADAAAGGVRVTLAVATKGEAGRIHDPAVGPVDDLAALRVAELRLACERIGIGPPRFLGFRDSGRGDRLRRDDPQALVNVDLRQVVHAVLEVIADTRPQVIVTHEPLGGYYHPDHMTVHRAVTAAFFAAGTLGEDAPVRLLYGATSTEGFARFADALAGHGVVDGLEPGLFGIRPEMVALDLDTRSWLGRKRGALAAHRSQFGLTLENMDHPPLGRPAAILAAFSPMLEREVYLLGGTRAPIPKWPLAGPFDGLDASPRVGVDSAGRTRPGD